MTKEDKKSKKKKKSPSIIIIIIIIIVIFIAVIYYYVFFTSESLPLVNQSVENYSIPTTSIDPADFVCPDQKYLNCMPPVLPTNEYCKNPYRKWISENCSEVTILE